MASRIAEGSGGTVSEDEAAACLAAHLTGVYMAAAAQSGNSTAEPPPPPPPPAPLSNSTVRPIAIGIGVASAALFLVALAILTIRMMRKSHRRSLQGEANNDGKQVMLPPPQQPPEGSTLYLIFLLCWTVLDLLSASTASATNHPSVSKSYHK